MSLNFKRLMPSSLSYVVAHVRVSSEAHDVRAMSDKERRRQEYYDRRAKPLPNVSPGEMVRMRLPGQTVRTPATCLDLAGPRSFLIKSGSAVFGETGNWGRGSPFKGSSFSESRILSVTHGDVVFSLVTQRSSPLRDETYGDVVAKRAFCTNQQQATSVTSN